MAWVSKLLAAPVFEDEEKTRVASLLNSIVLTALVLAVLFMLAAPLVSGNLVFSVAVTGALILLLAATFLLMRYGYVRFASLLLPSLLWGVVTLSAFAAGGVRSLSFSIYILVVLIAGLLLGWRGGIVFVELSILGGLGMLYADFTHNLPPPLIENVAISIWVTQTTSLIAAAALLNLATRSINEALGRGRRYAADLERQREHLEEMVRERTSDLTRRARYLEATAEVAREAASVLDPQGLLSRTAALISERFGFHYTGVYLLDSAGEWAVLQAASGEGGRRMLARGHQVRMKEEGIVSGAIRHGESRIALDAGANAVRFDNPDLPGTRSEMALPLRARGDILGALDVQSAKPEAFSPEDMVVLQTLADQVAMALSNAQLFQQVQQGLETERRTHGELTSQAWTELLRARRGMGFRKDRHGLVAVSDSWQPHMEKALRTGEITPGGDDGRALSTPVRMRGQVVAVLDARKAADAGAWTQEEIELMRTLADQLGVALEGARLYEDAHRRATRERLLANITARVRASTETDTILSTAIRELGQALRASDGLIRLAVGDGSEPSQGRDENAD